MARGGGAGQSRVSRCGEGPTRAPLTHSPLARSFGGKEITPDITGSRQTSDLRARSGYVWLGKRWPPTHRNSTGRLQRGRLQRMRGCGNLPRKPTVFIKGKLHAMAQEEHRKPWFGFRDVKAELLCLVASYDLANGTSTPVQCPSS